jgi:hypothetical protein
MHRYIVLHWYVKVRESFSSLQCQLKPVLHLNNLHTTINKHTKYLLFPRTTTYYDGIIRSLLTLTVWPWSLISTWWLITIIVIIIIIIIRLILNRIIIVIISPCTCIKSTILWTRCIRIQTMILIVIYTWTIKTFRSQWIRHVFLETSMVNESSMKFISIEDLLWDGCCCR